MHTLAMQAYTLGSQVGSNISRTATSSYGWLCSSLGVLMQQQQQQQKGQQESEEEGGNISCKV